MPIPYLKLDDRSFHDLVTDLVARIPGHTPEWTNPRIGDPGRTLIDLFAWLGDTILYRANLIPERQRLAFLKLLDIPMIPAMPSRGIVSVNLSNANLVQTVSVSVDTVLPGPVAFETRDEIDVLPLTSQVYTKRLPDEPELESLKNVIVELESVYNIKEGSPYITTPHFSDNMATKKGIDVAQETVDQSLWIALLVDKVDQKESVVQVMSRDNHGEWLINIGIQPRLEVPKFDEDVYRPLDKRQIWEWQLSTKHTDSTGEPKYFTLDTRVDTTYNFTRQGIIRLSLPDSDDWGIPGNDIDQNVQAGVGNHPPRIDDAELADKIVAWLRLKPTEPVQQLALSWIGINAVSIDQQKTYRNIVIGTSNGTSDQLFNLPATSVDGETLSIEVEESNDGFRPYQRIDDLASADRDDRVYVLDAEAGTLRFGNNVTGKQPEINKRIRVVRMRAGGGAAGNLSAGNLTAISHPGLKVTQPVANMGGASAETLDEAEKRIPAFLKHGDRAVNADDYQRLALDTPGVELGRVEVIPKFKPQQRLSDIPGVVSVMVIPKAGAHTPPNPRPDRSMLEQVHAYLEPRRPLSVELYVIGVEYIPLSASVAITYSDGHARDEVLQAVRDALRDYLWPLNPGGREQGGWPLGLSVSNQELEVAVARVPGVLTVNGVNLFSQTTYEEWKLVPENIKTHTQRLNLRHWQLPELHNLLVVEGITVPTSMDDGAIITVSTAGIPIPVVPEVC